MGIMKASVTALQGAAADLWKEAFCAGEMGSDLLMVSAKKIAGQNSANEGGAVISDGSAIIVGEGECAIATEGGKVIGIYDQPGENIFRSNQSSSFFGGGLGAFAKDVYCRISYGGDAAIFQRLYYINTKELTGGTIRAENVLMRCKNPKIGLDMDCSVSCHGSYTFRIASPELFYKAAIRTMDGRSRSALLQQMDAEVQASLAPALALLAEEGIRPDELLHHTDALRKMLCRVMSNQWSGLRGIEVASVALQSVSIPELGKINTLQQSAVYQDPSMAAGRYIEATANAMRIAAENAAVTAPAVALSEAGYSRWRCVCGTNNTGKFCTECGGAKPAQKQCRQCGWKADGQLQNPKFCPECGAPFSAQRC